VAGFILERMTVDFPDTPALDDFWRLKLEEAQRQYSADRRY
jgi:hypothetical protein